MDETRIPSIFDNVALNPKFRRQEAALLHALLQSSDYGVLVSGLDRVDILANRRLGELFSVQPDEIVQTDPDAVRAIALSRVLNPQAFEANLRRTYADPLLTYEDEIELRGNPPRVLRRFTAPVHGSNHLPIGRLWTFLDITETRRLQREAQAQLETRTQDYAATTEILRAMNAVSPLAMQYRATDDLLAALVQQLRGLGGADCAAILLVSNSGAHRQWTGMGCAPGQSVQSLPSAFLQDTALTEIASARENYLAAHPDHSMAPRPALDANSADALAHHLNWPTLALAPLISNNKLRGLFVLGLPAMPLESKGESNPTYNPDVRPEERTSSTIGASLRPTPCPLRPTHAILRHLDAVANQIAQTLQTHHLQSDLHATLDMLQATQARMVEIEKLRAAGTLAASVAHDIRNILTALQMEFEVAGLPDALPAGMRDQLDRFATLTHRLLAFSRPHALETSPVCLPDLLRRVLSLVQGQANIHAVSVLADLPDGLPFAAADPSQLEHLFINLCLNAIQAMTQHGGTLRLLVRSLDTWLEVEVADTGPGIPPELQSRVFEPFFTTRATGTGLGLFSCQRIVDEHGGRLTLASLPGQGTLFTVLLPVCAAAKESASGGDHASSLACG